MLKLRTGKFVEGIWPLVRADIPVFIHGLTGIGKTEICSGPLMEKVRKEWPGAVLHDYRFSSKEPVDGTGIPKLIDDDGEWATLWSRPGFVPKDDGKMHVFYLGEIGHASVAMQHIAYQFVRERRLGEYNLPRLNRVILDLNTREDKGGDTKLVKPLENRGAHVTLELKLEDWLKWAESNRFDPRLLAFTRLPRNLDHLHKFDANNPAFPTPRSVAELNKICRNGDATIQELRDAATALCGEGYGLKFYSFLEDTMAHLPKLSDIAENPKKARVPDKLDHQRMIAAAIAHEMADKPQTKASVENWVTYLQRLPADLASMAAHEAMNKNDKLSSFKQLKDLVLAS